MLISKTVLPLVLFTLLLTGCFNVENTETSIKSVAPPKGLCEVVFRTSAFADGTSDMTLTGKITESGADWVALDASGEVRWIPRDAILNVIVTPPFEEGLE